MQKSVNFKHIGNETVYRCFDRESAIDKRVQMENLNDKTESLRKAIYASKSYGLEYMSDPKNWVCVHLTKHEPKIDSEGKRCIETTAMATDYMLPRASVHVTLNQIVGNNLGGNWDGASVIVLAPYKDVVRLNGNPQEVATEDTYFIPDPDKGLMLPSSTYIIKPDNSTGKLFTVGKKKATYKTDNYTREDIDAILALSDNWDKDKYEKYMNGDVPDGQAEWLLGHDEKLIKLYKNAKDKKAFMRGLMEEDRFTLLNKILRDAVMKAAIEKMGYHYVYSHEDNISGRVAEVADKAGLRANSGNKGHSFSIEHDMEIEGCRMIALNKFLKEKSFVDIYDYLLNSNDPAAEKLISHIVSATPLPNYYTFYEKVFKNKIDAIKRMSEFYPHEKEKHLAYAEKLTRGGIKVYSMNLDRVLRRHAKKMQKETEKILEDMKKDTKGYALFKKRLCNIADTKVPLANVFGGNDGRM